jgi:hypothetical protein
MFDVRKLLLLLFMAAGSAAAHADDAPFVRTGILAAHPAPVGKGFPTILPSIDGDLVYSHYDDNGNTKSIVQFDFTNGRWAKLISGKTDPELIAQDARYIVYHTPHSASFPVEVIDRKTGTVRARLRLSNPVADAFIEGDRLVLFQGPASAYGFQQALAIFELPSLKLIQETTLPGARLVGIRDGRIYTAFPASGKDELMVFDRQFRALGRIQIPPPMDQINASCQPAIEQSENDRAVLIANCGEMHVLNLKSFSVEHSIRRYAFFYSMALHDGLIFTRAIDQPVGVNDGVVVFDMETGSETARLPIPAATIAIKGNILLAAAAPDSTGTDAKWQMETYRLNTGAMRKGVWREAKVAQQCRQAGAQLADTRDLYRAIALCKQAGVDGYAQGAAIPAAVLPALRLYGIWLSQTLDQGAEAVRVLEKVQAAQPDPEVALALAESRLKARVVGREGAGELTREERQTGFGKVFEIGAPPARTTVKRIEFGAFSDLFLFSGDRLYVGRYGCGDGRCDGGASLGVFDRDTLDELASVQIAPDNQEYQDAIASISADDRRIYACVRYRYEQQGQQQGRPNFFVVDRQTLEVIRRERTRSDETCAEKDKGNATTVTVDGTQGVDRQLIKLVSPAGDMQTLFGLPVTPLGAPVPILHEQTLYVGYGRDLLIYDLAQHRLRRYIRDFIHLDERRIERLVIDRGRLIALTFHSVNSRVMRLSDL